MTPATPTPAIALILARAGSKGVPGKNTALVGGKPCIAWTMEAARAARTLAHIAVSSDDPAALRLAMDAGFAALERPAVLATDRARVDDAARDAVEQLESRGIECGLIVLLYANVPIRPAGLIDRAVAMLRETGADSVQSYAPVGKHHPWWTARLDDSGAVQPWEGDTLNHNVFRRQDLPAAVIPDGGVLAVTRAALFHEIPGVAEGPHAFFGRDRRGVLNPEGGVVDIDSPIDLIVADTLLRQQPLPLPR